MKLNFCISPANPKLRARYKIGDTMTIVASKANAKYLRVSRN